MVHDHDHAGLRIVQPAHKVRIEPSAHRFKVRKISAVADLYWIIDY
jgi:hypothetical protein